MNILNSFKLYRWWVGETWHKCWDLYMIQGGFIVWRKAGELRPDLCKILDIEQYDIIG